MKRAAGYEGCVAVLVQPSAQGGVVYVAAAVEEAHGRTAVHGEDHVVPEAIVSLGTDATWAWAAAHAAACHLERRGFLPREVWAEYPRIGAAVKAGLPGSDGEALEALKAAGVWFRFKAAPPQPRDYRQGLADRIDYGVLLHRAGLTP